MQVFFPTTGIQIKLLSVWSFRLCSDHRNRTLFSSMGYKPVPDDHPDYDTKNTYGLDQKDHLGRYYTVVKLPAGTVMRVDRIHNQRAITAPDGLTLTILDGPAPQRLPWKKNAPPGGAVRFGVSLEDANQMDGTFVQGIAPRVVRENASLH